MPNAPGVSILNLDCLFDDRIKPIRAWVDGVQVEEAARKQLDKLSRLPVVGPAIAVMPDVHMGHGAAVGSVVPTRGAIIPSAVGVDIGCGMEAVRTNLRASDLPDDLSGLRAAIEAAIPHGRSNNGGAGDKGAWGYVPPEVQSEWFRLEKLYAEIVAKHPGAQPKNERAGITHLGTLGTGNHFVEICVETSRNEPDETSHGNRDALGDPAVWVMLHSGSRGVGNRIGSYFIELARRDMEAAHGYLPEDRDLCYLTEGTEHFADYVRAVSWAQDYARVNRELMMERTLDALDAYLRVKGHIGVGKRVGCLGAVEEAINCHHNYVEREWHYGEDLWVTRKGAVNAERGRLGVIPGSMGAKSFIVRGKGCEAAFNSCSHGAGRSMSRTEAKRRFKLEDHVRATEGVECRKDEDVIDETPMAYKPIDKVMEAQGELVDVVATIKQIVCVKG